MGGGVKRGETGCPEGLGLAWLSGREEGCILKLWDRLPQRTGEPLTESSTTCRTQNVPATQPHLVGCFLSVLLATLIQWNPLKRVGFQTYRHQVPN